MREKEEQPILEDDRLAITSPPVSSGMCVCRAAAGRTGEATGSDSSSW